MAPITLVAGKVTARRITEERMVPRIPMRVALREVQHPLHSEDSLESDVASRIIARYTRATPAATIKNIGVSVMVAVICKNAATIPIIKLAMRAIPVQSRRLQQFTIDI